LFFITEDTYYDHEKYIIRVTRGITIGICRIAFCAVLRQTERWCIGG